MFSSITLVVVSQHEKGKVISVKLEDSLGVTCKVALHLNTYALGTFNRELERKDDPVAKAHKKCLLSLENIYFDSAVSREGSFKYHPTILLVQANEDIFLFPDRKNNIEINTVDIISHAYFYSVLIKSEYKLLQFTKRKHFPSHALILRKADNDTSEIIKKTKGEDELLKHFETFLIKYGKAFAATDMRAMNNLTRLKTIERKPTISSKKSNKIVKQVNFLAIQFPKYKEESFVNFVILQATVNAEKYMYAKVQL
jgi:hypothetical protein